eukprot:TRINITY_DN2246_c0_g1::TRINITY_DN2246_c0_g1_i2::g.6696::m.6696 TRINITY_DN2246_c0_g1::TRINITY_DN2246_c0_g1_i2::g.6696  ORF type:complete len:204 (+),score=9.17,GrpE/PF01025.14/0.026,CR6_interact/PF10147.4/0.38,CR6_interact/PF10147.4/1.1e+02,EzrA/PF06160.7/0.038,FAD-oxidase_C/PF02913.14/0.11,IncA/PF04156.9/0.74,IncA/PF04156.9/5.4e+02,DUF3782/PF12644.2/30,DUF3782/PF12644.2/7.3e+02 TRINITY_DN2246_c0_g1_i2:193-804(+)
MQLKADGLTFEFSASFSKAAKVARIEEDLARIKEDLARIEERTARIEEDLEKLRRWSERREDSQRLQQAMAELGAWVVKARDLVLPALHFPGSWRSLNAKLQDDIELQDQVFQLIQSRFGFSKEDWEFLSVTFLGALQDDDDDDSLYWTTLDKALATTMIDLLPLEYWTRKELFVQLIEVVSKYYRPPIRRLGFRRAGFCKET